MQFGTYLEYVWYIFGISVLLLYLCSVLTKDLTIERDAELRKRVEDMLDGTINCQYYDWQSVVMLIAKQDAPKFYISPKKAEQYVCHYYRGRYLLKGTLGRAKIQDLVENYERLKEQYPQKPQKFIWQTLADSQAKSFYLSYKSIKSIIRGYIKREDCV